MKRNLKQRYISSAFILLVSTVIVKIISAVYKIPLTMYIGAEGRGYFSIAYNLCLPIHALTMGAFPIALTKLISSYNAKGDMNKVYALKKASKRLFFNIGIIGLAVMLVVSKPYTVLISSSPKSIYTILALAPSVFFSCLCAVHRSYAEGFLDMKATAISQLLEALSKMIFGLLFARLTMSYLYECYYLNNSIFGITLNSEKEALSFIYPLTSASAMLGVTFGSIIAWLFAWAYDSIRFETKRVDRADVKIAYNELLSFSAMLVGATVIQSISNFVDTSGIQYFLSLCDENVLKTAYSYNGNDIYTYVFGVYATVLDFKNLVPSIVMALGVTAVPAISSAYENSSERFSSLLSSIIKYSVIFSVLGGLILSLFYKEILSVFYLNSNADIVDNGSKILQYIGILILPCSVATTTVYLCNALGLAKNTIMPFIISMLSRVVLNYILVANSEINILGSAVSNFVGFLVIVALNLVTIHKKTNAKISILKAFFAPVLCGTVTYFIMNYAKKFVEFSLIKFIFSVLICVMIYLILLILTKTLKIKEKIA